MKQMKRKLAIFLSVAMMTQGITPAMAEVGVVTGKAETGYAQDLSTPADAGKTTKLKDEYEEKKEYGKGNEGSAPKEDESIQSQRIYDEDEEWMEEEEVMAATDANAQMKLPAKSAARSSSVGDLWEDWIGNMDFEGQGTEDNPYQIRDLADLMGLSEAVAAGMDFEGEYFALTEDIDMGNCSWNSGNWNPIGWYQNRTELGGEVSHPFRGYFDGGGNTIFGLRIMNSSLGLTNVGLFGVIDGGSVKNLTVEAENIAGEENAAILAGKILGDTVIAQVTVSGYVNSQGNAGGIAAEVTGNKKAVIENCLADGIVLNSGNREGYVGGIAGNVQNAWLADNAVITQDGDFDRIRGKGYVGGIAGRINRADIYNVYVDGTVGGNGSRAVGGIIGKYCSGNLILARMAGDVSATNNGIASREGTFVGTRESRDTFTYGTEKNSNLSYLFTNDGAKAKRVWGSGLDRDNIFTEKAHIGYWIDNETKYILVTGGTKSYRGERYFYEELEDGVRYMVTHKLNQDFTASGDHAGLPFCPDHFAPGHMGQPVKGYLVSVPRIDAQNGNGSYDTDIAELTAMPGTNQSYYRVIDKDHAAAIAPGTVVTVATAPKNTGENRYQMIVDPDMPGGVKPPVYHDSQGKPIPMNYVYGGTYSFVMPEWNTELNAEYIRASTKLTLNPAETAIHVTQIRSGDRKNPRIVTEVTDKEGILIARYIDGAQDNSVQVQPVTIHGEQNGTEWGKDRTMKWSVDDTNLLTNLSESGYTIKDAVIMPNLSSRFIRQIIDREVQAQADNQYKEKINNTIYSQYAVVTAAANPATSADNRPVYANCRVQVTFQIIDNTTVRVEGMKLNRDGVHFTITRKLTGDRMRPEETITCSAPVVLTATLSPERPFFKNVSWKDKEAEKILSLHPQGNYTQDCQVSVKCDTSGQANPAWIQNILLQDGERKKANPYERLHGAGTCTETVEAVSEDQTNGHQTASCAITIDFATEDETILYPEAVSLAQEELCYFLSYDYTGNIFSSVRERNGFGRKDTLATVFRPELPLLSEFCLPYDQSVRWHSSDPDAVTIADDGTVVVMDNARWIQEALKSFPYKGEKTVEITAEAGGQRSKPCKVKLYFQANTADAGKKGGGSGGKGSGGSGGGVAAAIAGQNVPLGARVPDEDLPDYVVSGSWQHHENGEWTFSAGEEIYTGRWAAIYNPYARDEAGQDRFAWFFFDDRGVMISGWHKDKDGKIYYLNPLSDGTKGQMVTGWNWIEGEDGKIYCYYFNEDSDGAQGAMACGMTTPDGYEVDRKGRWIIDGVPQSTDRQEKSDKSE